MLAVTVLWLGAMVSGLCWARRVTGVFVGAAALAFLGAHSASLSQPSGWIHLAIVMISPWLLAGERVRREQLLKQLTKKEAVHLEQLKTQGRSLMTIQTTTQQLEASIAQITELYHVTKETSRALHLKELFLSSVELAPRLLKTRGLRLIDLVSSPDKPAVLRARKVSDGRLSIEEPNESNHLVPLEQAILDEAIRSRAVSSASEEQLPCEFPQGVSRVAWAPLVREQKPIGVLIADDLPAQQLETLSIVANQLSLQLSRIHLYQQVEAMAVTDALTGLFVRRHFLERAREEFIRATRHGLSCALLMVDLDLFKLKNDTYGHLAGDVVLKTVAGLLSENLREIDLIARYGGEEFILLLIESTPEQALLVAERLRQIVEVYPIRAYDELLTQTISVGLSCFPDDAQELQELIDCSDAALYAAKRSGRNHVVRWSPSTTVHPGPTLDPKAGAGSP